MLSLQKSPQQSDSRPGPSHPGGFFCFPFASSHPIFPSMARKTCSGCFYFSFSPSTQQSIKEFVHICSFPVIFVSTTITPAPVISGCTGCPPPDRNSCAYLSEQKDCLANGSGLRLMTLFTEDKDQRSVCSLPSKAISFSPEKKSLSCVSF